MASYSPDNPFASADGDDPTAKAAASTEGGTTGGTTYSPDNPFASRVPAPQASTEPKPVRYSSDNPFAPTANTSPATPAKPPLLAPRDASNTRATPDVNPHPSHLPEPIASIMKFGVDPMLENPLTTVGMGVSGPIGATVATGQMLGDLAQYGGQKAAELTMDPAMRRVAEADPSRISGKQAAVESGALALPLVAHAALKAVVPGANVEAAPGSASSGSIIKDLAASVKQGVKGAGEKIADTVAPHFAQERRTLDRAANTDAMTGLGNQRALDEHLSHAEADPNTQIISIDLDGLKNLNDTKGHAAGDEAIKRAAAKIHEAVPGAAAFHAHGDEFTVTLPSDIPDAAQRIMDAYGVFDHGDGVKTSLSAGAGNTMAEADASMYERKRANKAANGIPDRNGVAPTAEAPAETPTETSARVGQPEAPTYGLRDLIGKGADEIDQIARQETAREKNTDTDIFGEEGAKRYNDAQRVVNSPTGHLNPERYDAASKTIEDMEGSLTEEQRNRLFGIGQTGLNGEELRAAARAAREYSPENLSDASEGDLLSTVGRELTTGAPHKDVVSALRLRGAAQELQRRSGQPLERLLAKAVEERGRRGFLSSGEQGAELLSTRLNDLRKAGFFSESTEPTTQARAQLPAADASPGGAREARAGFVVDHDGVERHVDARTESGARRDPAKVSTQGLIEELVDLDEKRADAMHRSQYRYTQDENFHSTEDGRTAVSATRKNGGPSEQAKALKNLDDYARAQDQIFEALKKRGLEDHEIWHQVVERQAVRAEGAESAHAGVSDGQETSFPALPINETAEMTRGASPGRARPSASITETPSSLSPAPNSAEPDIAGGQSRSRSQSETVGSAGDVGKGVASEAPSPGRAAIGGARAVDELKRVWAPASRGPQAAEISHIVRAKAAEQARSYERAVEQLRTFGKSFNAMPRAERLDFIDRMERGASQPTPALTAAARAIRSLLDTTRDEIRALGTGKLDHFIDDYFPHIWADPEKAKQVMSVLGGKRPLEGPKSFLKKRTIPTIREGIENGLEPVTTNPVELTLLKLREMQRYLLAQRIYGEAKPAGLIKFVPAMEKAPNGYARINDNSAVVYGSPAMKIREAYDAVVREKLTDVMNGLPDFTHERVGSTGREAIGFAERSGKRMVTEFGSYDGVIMHELGHILDFRYGIWDRLTDIPRGTKESIQLHRELRSLADERFRDREPSPSYKKYVRKEEEKVANAVHALIYAPELMQEVAPLVYRRLTNFLASKPELAPLLDIKPSLVLGVNTTEIPVGGLVVKGEYWAPEPVATILNNYLSPGLRGRSAIYDAYMGAGNLLNQAQLGLSAFHVGFTSLDATTSQVAVGIQNAAAGRGRVALRQLATAPLAPVTTLLRGDRLLRAYLGGEGISPDLQMAASALVDAGGRARMDSFYKTGAVESFLHALRERKGIDRVVGAGAWATPAVFEAAARPVLEYIVPRQKLGVFLQLAEHEFATLPEGASVETKRAALARAWDSVDNRLGQLVYDNLFWKRTLKDGLMASVRSVGWNLGTFRELAGGAADIASNAGKVARGEAAEVTPRMAYVAALPLTVAMIGAIYQYLMTGSGPTHATDYFFPRTGKNDRDGNPERVALPSYIKDIAAYGRHPLTTLEHKLHPLISTVAEMLNNQDFYGDMIRNPDDPAVVQMQQLAQHLETQFVPFGIRNAQEQTKRAQGPTEKALGFVGVTAAPREIVRTPAQNKMNELLARRGQPTLTPEQVATSQKRMSLLEDLRAHVKGRSDVQSSVRAGDLTRGQGRSVLGAARHDALTARFQQLTLDDALKVWALASPSEKTLWARTLDRKATRAHRREELPKDVRQYRQREDNSDK